MTRVLSGVVLGAVALALIWFLSSIALLRRRAGRRGDRLPRIRAHRRRDRREGAVLDGAAGDAAGVRDGAVPVGRHRVGAGGVAAADRAQRADVGSRRRAAARRHRGGGAGAGLHRPAAGLPGRRARDRRARSGAAADRDRRGQRHRAVLHRPHVRTHAAGAATQPEEDARGRDRRLRDRADRFSRSPARTGCRRIPGAGTPASASASSSPASSAICSSRC